jgi:hypothetical protein
MEILNVVLDPLNELCLVFPDSAPDVRAYEQGIETREDPEHLIGILGCSKLITQTGSDSGLNTIDSLIIPVIKGQVARLFYKIHVTASLLM